MYQTIPVDLVRPAEDNVRRRPGDVKDLAASIASVGVIEPLLVCPRDDGCFTVVAGHRRLRAARQAGLVEIPCVVKELSEAERLETMIAENLARQALNPVEEAQAFFRMVELSVPVKDLAQRLGRSAKHITTRLALLELPAKVQTKIERGEVGLGEAASLLALKAHPDVIDRLLADEWDRRDLNRAAVREVARIEAEAKVAAAAEQLHAAGVTIVEKWNRHGGRGRQPVVLGSGHGELDVKPAKHKREPCHAAHFTRAGEIVWLCTDPARHRSGGESRVAAAATCELTAIEERAAEREAIKQRRAEDRERQSFVADLVGRRLARGDLVALALDQFLATATNNQARAACILLAIDEATEQLGAGHRIALLDYASQSPSNRDRAGFALALGLGEDIVRSGDTDGRSDVGRRHLDFIVSYGWACSDPEGAPELRLDTAASISPT